MKRLLFSLLAVFSSLMFLSSCINEDLGQCNAGVRVYFSYDLPSTDDTSETATHRLNLLVFDESDLYVGEWVDEAAVLNDDYYMFLPLKAGRYRFVAYSGLILPCMLTPSSLVVGETTYDEMRMLLSRRSDGAVTNLTGRIYFGDLAEATASSTKTEHFKISLYEITNRIYVTVKGVNNLTPMYRLRIDDTNGEYKLDNSFSSAENLFYTTLCNTDNSAATIKGDLTVMRLARDRKDAILTFREEASNKILYEDNLIELILKLEEKIGRIDFDKMHDYDIVLQFTVGMDVIISVNGWIVTDQAGPLN